MMHDARIISLRNADFSAGNELKGPRSPNGSFG